MKCVNVGMNLSFSNRIVFGNKSKTIGIYSEKEKKIGPRRR